MPIDFLDGGISCGTGHEVDSDLVPVEIEIDPFIRSTAFAAAKHASIKVPRRSKVMNGEGKMKRAVAGQGRAIAKQAGENRPDPASPCPRSP